MIFFFFLVYVILFLGFIFFQTAELEERLARLEALLGGTPEKVVSIIIYS